MPGSTGLAVDPSAAADARFNALALELFAAQFAAVAPYAAWCRSLRRTPAEVTRWEEIPALPTSAFKAWGITGLPAGEIIQTFQSSGTTRQERSRHHHGSGSLPVYQRTSRAWFRQQARREVQPVRLVSLTPAPSEVPQSSLVHMLAHVTLPGEPATEWLGGDSSDGWVLEPEKVRSARERISAEGRPVWIAGTAFNFVHDLDRRSTGLPPLPPGSIVMETGGYKGRSRELSRDELHAGIARSWGVPRSHVITEYGMCELSSQGYRWSAPLAGEAPAPLALPPWARVRIVSPETLDEVPEGSVGMIRWFDLANVGSVLAVQTEDLGRRVAGGFELLGRGAGAEPRGCSLLAA